MRLDVQDGTSLSGSQLRALVTSLPKPLLKGVAHIYIRAWYEPSIRASYRPHHLMMEVPAPPYAVPLPTEAVVRELLIALAVIAERGELPAKLSTSLRLRAIQATEEFMALVPDLSRKRTRSRRAI